MLLCYMMSHTFYFTESKLYVHIMRCMYRGGGTKLQYITIHLYRECVRNHVLQYFNTQLSYRKKKNVLTILFNGLCQLHFSIVLLIV